MAASRIIYHARAVSAPLEIAKALEKMFFQFLWKPERIEKISRKSLIAEKASGGLQIPDPFSKITAAHLEKLAILTRISKPEEFWQKHLIYQLGSKVKLINEKLYYNRVHHIVMKDSHILKFY